MKRTAAGVCILLFDPFSSVIRAAVLKTGIVC